MTRWLLLLFIAVLIACSDAEDVTPTPTTPPTVETTVAPSPTATLEPGVTPSPTPRVAGDTLLIGIDVPDRSGLFANFDANGQLIGLDVEVMEAIASAENIPFQWRVSPFDSLYDAIRMGELDVASARIDVSHTPPAGISFTDPYLEIGQILVVRANEETIATWRDLAAEEPLVVVEGSYGAFVARNVMEHENIVEAPTAPDALQILSDFEARAAIVNSLDAESYTDRYYQRLKTVGSGTPDYWIAGQQFGMAVSADDPTLLTRLNEAIFDLDSETIAQSWLASNEAIDAGDSLIGTPDDRMLIGVVGSEVNFDPAESYDRISNEIQLNTLSGLVRVNDNGEIVADLAEELPEISADKLTYTFTLRDDVTFPDGSALTATAVKNSMMHVASTGSILYNLLKDANIDGFADNDAITVLNDSTIQFTLSAPAGHFLSRLATPAFAVISPLCDFNAYDPQTCLGIAPYRVEGYEPNAAVRLIATSEDVPMERVEIRLYPSSGALTNALELDAIDVAWHGLSDAGLTSLLETDAYTVWEGAGIFKSYLVFEQSEPPWDDVRVRQAASLAVDREAIARDVFDNLRAPLTSPLVNGLPSQTAAYPERDLTGAVRLLRAAGYGEANRAEIDLWYLNDGRYTDLEEDYATAIAAQLEETGIFDVTLNGQSWGVYSGQMFNCNYPTFLLGWPPTSAPPYLDGLNWTYYFILNAPTVCSNYESEEMDALFDALFEAATQDDRSDVMGDIQTLWAEELPTLDLYQDLSEAVSLQKVTGLQIDPLGFLRYDSLEK